ncbi:MAG TPA: DUF58 domain-containing protein [Mycobacterium sp.]
MGKHLNRAKAYFGTDTRGMLEGGRYALLHTRSLELDELRPYVPGDDVRDIDWKASARSGSVLTKRFVSEKHHKVLLVADAGRNMCALAPGGELKSDVAVNVLGAIGLITLGRTDEVGMVYGDARGSVNVRQRRGENHIESLLTRYHNHTARGPSDIICQLTYVATHYRHPMLIVVVSDEPDADPRLTEVLTRLTARHDVMWAMVPDMPAVAAAEEGAYDVATGRRVLGAASHEPRVVAAYRLAEQRRIRHLAEALTSQGIPHVTIPRSESIRSAIAEMTGVWSRAG